MKKYRLPTYGAYAGNDFGDDYLLVKVPKDKCQEVKLIPPGSWCLRGGCHIQINTNAFEEGRDGVRLLKVGTTFIHPETRWTCEVTAIDKTSMSPQFITVRACTKRGDRVADKMILWKYEFE